MDGTKACDGQMQSLGVSCSSVVEGRETDMGANGNFIVTPSPEDQKFNSLGAQRFQAALVGAIGHDLRQSLQVIQRSYALLRSRLDDTLQRTWVERGQRAVAELIEQFNSLADAFFVAERVNKLERSPVSLGPLFSRLQHDHKYVALQGEIDLRVVATSAYVGSNAVLLSCILRNLVTNAIKYTRPGGCILIGCRRRGAEVGIHVYDTGMGIPEQQLPLIFEPFTRLSPQRDDGMGIGLSIVRRALEILGHRIEVRSVVGRGSLFSVFAPVAPVGEDERSFPLDLRG
jgi:two-component system phosphate regulon sensor histidine kinase PhoR